MLAPQAPGGGGGGGFPNSWRPVLLRSTVWA